jgi:DNA-binding MarR family transcriptional regulator
MMPGFKNNSAPLPLPGLLDIASNALFHDFRSEMQQSEFGDIRPTHGCVFRYMEGKGLRLTDIAERANMTKQSVGEIVDDLVARGYVKRIPDPDDRRAKLICLTARGERAQDHGRHLFIAMEKRLGERYGRERIAQLRALLEEIVATEAPFAMPGMRPEPATA